MSGTHASSRLDLVPGARFYSGVMNGDGLLTVGQVTRRTGLSRKALRLYEQAALVMPATRSDAGYRLYDESVLPRLDLIRRARALDVGIAELGELLDIAEGRSDRAHEDLAALVAEKLQQTEQRIAELRALEFQLRNVQQRLGLLAAAPVDRASGCGSLLCTCPVPEPGGTASGGTASGSTASGETASGGTASSGRGGDDMNPTELEQQNAEGTSTSCDCGCECCTPQSDNKKGTSEQAKGESLATAGGCNCGCGD